MASLVTQNAPKRKGILKGPTVDFVEFTGQTEVCLDPAPDLCDTYDRVWVNPTDKKKPLKHSATCTSHLSPEIQAGPSAAMSATAPTGARPDPPAKNTRNKGQPKGSWNKEDIFTMKQ